MYTPAYMCILMASTEIAKPRYFQSYELVWSVTFKQRVVDTWINPPIKDFMCKNGKKKTILGYVSAKKIYQGGMGLIVFNKSSIFSRSDE